MPRSRARASSVLRRPRPPSRETPLPEPGGRPIIARRRRMRVGVPKEVKTHEYRVGLVPGSVRELVHHGHGVIVETGAGLGIGISDEDYRRAGARIAAAAEEIFAADMIVKVKEPQPHEIARLHDGQVLFPYLHLAADRAQ